MIIPLCFWFTTSIENLLSLVDWVNLKVGYVSFLWMKFIFSDFIVFFKKNWKYLLVNLSGHSNLNCMFLSHVLFSKSAFRLWRCHPIFKIFSNIIKMIILENINFSLIKIDKVVFILFNKIWPKVWKLSR